MAGNYSDRLSLIDVSAGHQDPNTGQWVDGETTTHYDGKCDGQELGNKGLQIAKAIEGVSDYTNVLEVYLKDESNIMNIPVNAAGTLTRKGVDLKVKVLAKRVIDGVLIIESNL